MDTNISFIQHQWIEKSKWNGMNVFIRVRLLFVIIHESKNYTNYIEIKQKNSNWEVKYKSGCVWIQMSVKILDFDIVWYDFSNK